MRRPRVELLYIEDCPNYEHTRAVVEQLAGELALRPEVELILVQNAAAATRLRFLGSPTVRVDGRDVEPGADELRTFAHACRLYERGGRLAGEPDESWIRRALTEAAA